MILPLCPTDLLPMKTSFGGHFSPELRSQNVECPLCKRTGWYISDYVGNAVVFISMSEEGISADQLNAYVNAVLLPTWRARQEQIEDHNFEESRRWKEEVFYPKFPEFRDWPQKLTFHDLSLEARAFYAAQFGGTADRPSHVYGAWLPLPQELKEAVVPPQIPEGFPLQVFYLKLGDSRGWELVDPVHSRTLPVPRDPILVRNEAFFASVLSLVEAEIGEPLPPRQETKNRYGGLQPWYTFVFHGVELTVGWRKRVTAIQAKAPFVLPLLELEALSEADNVTFSVGDSGRQVEVHAWGKEKLVAYLATFFKAIVKKTAVMS